MVQSNVSMFNFKMRRDVTSCRLHNLLQVQVKINTFWKTKHLTSKVDKVSMFHQQIDLMSEGQKQGELKIIVRAEYACKEGFHTFSNTCSALQCKYCVCGLKDIYKRCMYGQL